MSETEGKLEDGNGGLRCNEGLGIQLSVTELMVIVDTLIGSASLADGGRLFKYQSESRSSLADSLLERLERVKVNA